MIRGLFGVAIALLIVGPLAWKWQLGLRRVLLFVVTCGIVCSLFVGLLPVDSLAKISTPALSSAVAVLTLVVSTIFLAYRFYRDPERISPEQEGTIVSPADGTVIYIKKSEDGQVPIANKHGRTFPLSELLKTEFASSAAWVIGISMSFLDVHVNRAPIAGKIAFQKHFPGKFGSLRVPERVFDNERATIVIENQDLSVAVVQIASRLVRQIASYVKLGDQVLLGQRIGVIRLGSQVDLVVPIRDDLHLLVENGQVLVAGQSVIGCITCNRTGSRLKSIQSSGLS